MADIKEHDEIMSNLYVSLSRYFGIRPTELSDCSTEQILELIKAQDTITHYSLLTADSVDSKDYADEYTLLIRYKPNKY